jgi:hypothetical protein
MKLATHGGARMWIVIVVTIGFLAVLAKNAGSILVIDAPEKSDVILVLAGEANLRPKQGFHLLDQGYGRMLVLDVPAAAEVYGFTEKELAEREIAGLPEARSIRICPIPGLSTKSEARDAEQCLDRIGGKRVLIVTSDFHSRRALSTFKKEIHEKIFSISAVHDETQFGVRWWQHRQWAKTCVDEWLRMAWWNVVDRWR